MIVREKKENKLTGYYHVLYRLIDKLILTKIKEEFKSRKDDVDVDKEGDGVLIISLSGLVRFLLWCIGCPTYRHLRNGPVS